MAQGNKGNQHTSLYNSRVVEAQKMNRPLTSSGTDSGKLGGAMSGLGIQHQGVKVTTERGDKFLVHKGPGYGKASETVVTPASNMSSAWKPSGAPKTVEHSRVGDYVQAGGKNYKTLGDNCQHAASRMMKKP